MPEEQRIPQRWRKIGGGSLRWGRRVIKPGQIFEAFEDALPEAFRGEIVPVLSSSRSRRSVITISQDDSGNGEQERTEKSIKGALPDGFMPPVAYILGGGPSLADVDLSALEGQFVIAVNRAYEIYPQADLLFFADKSFYDEHEEGIHESPIPRKVTTCSSLRVNPDFAVFKRVPRQTDFMKSHFGDLFGTTSGQMSIDLAAQLGAKLIVMLGFDMRMKDGHKHWHDGYQYSSMPRTCDEMLDGMFGFRAVLQKKYGADLLHATPDSAYTEADYFPLADIIHATQTLRYFGGWWLPGTEQHFIMMLRKSRAYKGRLTYQYWNKLKPALGYLRGRDGMAVDIGSNVGFWTWPLSHEFETVHCFEPVPTHHACWELNLQNTSNVVLHTCGLSDEKGALHFESPDSSCGGTHVADHGILRPVRTLDSFRQLKNVSFLKVDCEGYELPILQGGEKLLKRDKPLIVVEQKAEWEDRYPFPSKGAVTYLESLGARVYQEIVGDYIMGWD